MIREVAAIHYTTIFMISGLKYGTTSTAKSSPSRRNSYGLDLTLTAPEARAGYLKSTSSIQPLVSNQLRRW
jgi:hypothetical protein